MTDAGTFAARGFCGRGKTRAGAGKGLMTPEEVVDESRREVSER